MRKFIISMAFFLFIWGNVAAEEQVWVPNLTVDQIRIHTNTIFVKVSDTNGNALAGTCSNYGYQIKFGVDSTVASFWLSTLLAAKTTSNQVQMWYIPEVSGVNSGCGGAELKILALQ